MVRSDTGRIADLLLRMLAGQDDELIALFTRSLALSTEVDLCLRRFHEMDVEMLRLFHRFGPVRNRALREQCIYGGEVIAQNDLDDLLVVAPKPRPTRHD